MYKIYNKKILLVFIVALLMVVLAVLASCNTSKEVKYNKLNTQYSKDELELSSPERLSIVTEPSYEPFEYMDDGHLAGVDIDIAYMIADSLDLPAYIYPYSYASLSDVIENDKSTNYDLVINSIVLNERHNQYTYLSDPYYTYKFNMLFVPLKDSPINESNFDNMANSSQIKIAISQDSSLKEYVKEIYPNANIVLFSDSQELKDSVINKKADVLVYDDNTYELYCDKEKTKIVKSIEWEEDLVIGVRKGASKLLQTVNEIIAARHADSSIDKILSKYDNIIRVNK